MNLKETDYDVVDWFRMAQNGNHRVGGL